MPTRSWQRDLDVAEQHQSQSKRIAELEAENLELRFAYGAKVSELRADIARLERENAALQAVAIEKTPLVSATVAGVESPWHVAEENDRYFASASDAETHRQRAAEKRSRLLARLAAYEEARRAAFLADRSELVEITDEGRAALVAEDEAA